MPRLTRLARSWYRACVSPSYMGALITRLEVYKLTVDGGEWVPVAPPASGGCWLSSATAKTSFEPVLWGRSVEITFFGVLGAKGPRYVERLKKVRVDGAPYVRAETPIPTRFERELHLQVPRSSVSRLRGGSVR